MIKSCWPVLLFILLSSLVAEDLPAYLKAQPKSRSAQHVAYAGEGFDLVIDPTLAAAKQVKEEQLFAVRFLNQEILAQLPNYGEVLYVSQEKQEAIMRLTDPEKHDKLAALLHSEGGVWGCGSIVQVLPPSEVMAPLSGEAQAAIQSTAKRISDETRAGEIEKLVGLVDGGNIRKFVEELSVYQNRYHRSSHGAASANFIYETFQRFTASNPNLSVRKFSHSGTPQPSIIATLKGTVKPEEIVIVGCHIDSINNSGQGDPDQHAPGADDNASGTASVKEILRVLATHGHKFKRTIEFHGYAAEEIGLVGSNEIASSYKSQGKKVIGMVQLDMNIFVSSGSQPRIWLVRNDTDSQHNSMAERLAAQYTSLPISQGSLFAGTSDHRSWFRRGYPTIFPTENVNDFNRKIHTTGDIVGNSGNFTLATNISKLALAYLVTLAEIE